VFNVGTARLRRGCRRTGRVWARAPGSLALKLWASAIWDGDPPRSSGPPPPADEADTQRQRDVSYFPAVWGGGGQWARGRFVEASLCDDASSLGGSIEAGVESATGGRRRSQERVGSRVQRIRDYHYPAEGSLADKLGLAGGRDADGDRKVATWALQPPVSRCLPALGNASQLLRPFVSAHRVGEWAPLRIRHLRWDLGRRGKLVVGAYGGGVWWDWELAAPGGFVFLGTLSTSPAPLSLGLSAWNVADRRQRGSCPRRVSQLSR